ncbi:MAG TPA: hypothetical protein VGL42_06830 [Opitutaceae bacterium]|jgi:hypothetical protein
MKTVAGILQRSADEPFWAWSAPTLELAPHQAVFFFRLRDQALMGVEVAGSDPRSVPFNPGCEGWVVSRDFGVRLRLPCQFAGGVPGEIDAEVRLRLLDQAGDWPRRLPQTAALVEDTRNVPPAEALGRVAGSLFEAEIVRFAGDQAFGDLQRRQHDPKLVAELEDCLRRALARWTEEGIVGLLAAHLLAVESPEAEKENRSALECHRLEREHACNVRKARQAAELAELERQRALDVPDEVRWRLFEPADLVAEGSRPPRMIKESSAPHEALVSGQHLQLVVRPVTAGEVHVLALGPYRDASGGVEYRWMRLFGPNGRSDLVQRSARPGGNRVEAGEVLLFPGDAGASELFQHYLTLDAAPGWESLVVAIRPAAVAGGADPGTCDPAILPHPSANVRDFRKFQDELNRGLQATFGTDARIYLFQFHHG